MGGNQSVIQSTTSEIRNEFLNRAELQCDSQCSQSQNGNIIVVEGSVGNIEISQKCQAESSCVIKNSLDASVESIIDNLLTSDQDYQSSLFTLSWNSQRTVQENTNLLHNKITNIISASCNSNVNQMQSDTIIYVRGRADSIALTQEGNAKSNCTLDNIAKMTAYNDIANDIENGQGRTSAFGAMMAAIATIIIFAIIMMILMMMFTGVAGVVSAVKGDGEPKSSEADILKAEALKIAASSGAANVKMPATAYVL